jgi:phosphotransacetylase
MYTGETIDELMQMVARVEEHVQAMRHVEAAVRDRQEFASQLVYTAEAQPMMIGVA